MGYEARKREKFGKEKRIRKERELKEVMESGNKYYTPNFIIFLKNTTFPNSRLGIIATKKYGRSVRRNRAKRLIREVFRKNFNLLPCSLDIVVVVKNTACDLFYSECEMEYLNVIKKFFKDMGIFRKIPS